MFCPKRLDLKSKLFSESRKKTVIFFTAFFIFLRIDK
nr:MAG TPA: hypothetical protein [Caudoviricetes sp.]